MIELVCHKGFPWYEAEGCRVKGYLFTAEGALLEKAELAAYFTGVESREALMGKLDGASGMYSAVLETGARCFMLTDLARTFPLFYALRDGKLRISDSADHLAKQGERMHFNAAALDEFRATGFVSGDETLAEGVFQVEAGQVVEWDGTSLGKNFYWTYQSETARSLSVKEELNSLEAVAGETFERLVESLGGRMAVVALSGGYDSRLILAMLCRMNYTNILAYSYGRKANREMEVAARVAGELKVKFIPIVYDEALIGEFEKEEAFHDYVDYASNLSSMFFMQEYFAVRYLKSSGLLSPGAVFIPGHSADFLAGSMFLKDGLQAGPESGSRTVNRIFGTKYIYGKPASVRLAKERITQNLESKMIVENASSFSRYEDWDLKEKFAKFIVNSCAVYTWFGYSFRLPFYDTAFMNFFRDLPYELKLNKVLYDTWLREGLFRMLEINFEDEIQPAEGLQRRARLKTKIKRLIPGVLRPSRLSVNDDIFYHEITGRLVKDLANRGMHISSYGGKHNSLLISWYLAYLKLKYPDAN